MTEKGLTDSSARAAVMARLERLTPESPRRWGRMTAHQAICHLSDSFRAVMAPTPPKSVSTLLSRTVVKWIALRAPMPWPHGVQTLPEVDQEIGGTKPVEFAVDRSTLAAAVDEFSRRTGHDLQPHPIFGRLSTWEWQRWGYLHIDHHLRQFGV